MHPILTWAMVLSSEWCGEFIDADHETLWHLIKRFGLTTGQVAARY